MNYPIQYPSLLSKQILEKNFSEKDIDKAYSKIDELEKDNPEYTIDGIVYYGDVVSQSRPRATSRGKFIRMYDHPKVADFKATFKEFVINEIFEAVEDHIAYFPAAGSFKLNIKVFRPIPVNWSKRNKILAEVGYIRPESKPDFDNLAKSICDAINAVIYKDDGQIVNAVVDKYFSDVPRAEVSMTFRIKQGYKR